MQERELLQSALGLAPPWRVVRSEFDAARRRLDIYLDFAAGSRFACPGCGTACPAYDTEEASWRHLNFFQHEAYLHARVPRVECKSCGIKRVALPWARSGSGFTLLFEALVMALVQAMPVRAAARLVAEHDTRLWRIIHHYVDKARAAADFSDVRRVGVDETAVRRGYQYVSLFVDLDRSRILFATPGKDADTLEAFAQDLCTHRGDPEAITDLCCDMSPAFIKGAVASLPQAAITFDKFHLVKLINDALDEVRRAEQRTVPDLKATRHLWLRNPASLSSSQAERLEALNPSRSHLKTARAYRIRLAFQELYTQPAQAAESYLKRWYFWTTHSRLPPMITAARAIKRNWQGVLRWFEARISNGILEGLNSLIQAAKAKARGYRSHRNLCAIIYLLAGKLQLGLPT
jgi:transposase